VERHDLIVIGAGPGGYVAAIRAAQLGLDVACIDEHDAPGGTCLRVGCIPSKALLHSSERLLEARESLGEHGIRLQGVELDLAAMMKRKERVVRSRSSGVRSLLKKNGVSFYRGRGRLLGEKGVEVKSQDGTRELRAERILLATGSKPAGLPGLDLELPGFGTSTDALSYEQVPERLVVIGAGYIGLELGSVWNRLGSQVVVLEMEERILPVSDGELAQQAAKILEKQGLELRLGCKVVGARAEEGRPVVEIEGGEELPCDRVLVAPGRLPMTDGLGLESVGIEPESSGRVPVGDDFATSAPGVYAIGDLIRGPMLAHKASHEAVACVERMVSGFGAVEYDAIPSVVYTHPEIAAVGPTEEQLQEQGVAYRKGAFPFRASGRARSLGDVEGMVKVLAAEEGDRLLGVHILGPRAGDLIAEAAAAIAFGASAEDLSRVPHAHPTLAEALQEAALAAGPGAIHI
jgi:dihydrolipoamide dehydrogenase